MKKFSILALVAGAFIFTSCGALKSYVANYSVGLATIRPLKIVLRNFGQLYEKVYLCSQFYENP
jgi:hypothetical protein